MTISRRYISSFLTDSFAIVLYTKDSEISSTCRSLNVWYRSALKSALIGPIEFCSLRLENHVRPGASGERIAGALGYT